MVRCMTEDILYTKELVHKSKISCIRQTITSLASLAVGISLLNYSSSEYRDVFLLVAGLIFILNFILANKSFRRFKKYEREDAMYEMYQRCPNKVEVAWYEQV